MNAVSKKHYCQLLILLLVKTLKRGELRKTKYHTGTMWNICTGELKCVETSLAVSSIDIIKPIKAFNTANALKLWLVTPQAP